MVIKKIVVFFFILVTLNGSLFAKKRVFNSINAIAPFRCSFTQKLYEDGCLELEEKGYIVFKNIDKIRWEYIDPQQKIALINKEIYKFYDKEMEQVSVGTIKDNWFFHILKKNELKEFKPYNFYYKDKEKDITYKIICDKDYLPVKIEQEDNLGFKTIYILNEYKKKVKLKKEYFLIKVPKNTEIINFD